MIQVGLWCPWGSLLSLTNLYKSANFLGRVGIPFYGKEASEIQTQMCWHLYAILQVFSSHCVFLILTYVKSLWDIQLLAIDTTTLTYMSEYPCLNSLLYVLYKCANPVTKCEWAPQLMCYIKGPIVISHWHRPTAVVVQYTLIWVKFDAVLLT